MSAPTGRGRLRGVDAARGVALVGMMAVHVLPAVAPDGGVSAAYLLVSGRSAALFALLAGAGLALATGRRSPPRGGAWAAAATGTLGRAAVIGLVGLALGELDSGVAVILPYYALLFLLAVPLLPLPPRAAAGLAATVALAVPVASLALRAALPPPSYANPTLDSLADPARLLAELAVTGYYPALAWVAYLATGLAVGRLDLTSVRVAAALALGGAGLAVAASAVSALLLHPLGGLDRLLAAPPYDLLGEPALRMALDRGMYGTTPTSTWWWLAVDAPHSSTPLDLLHTIGTSLLVLGTALLVLEHGPALLAVLLRPLVAAGSMTLTLYTVHVAALGLDLGPGDPQRRYGWHVALALLLATAWRRWIGRGPLELLAHRVAGGLAAPVRVLAGPAAGVSARERRAAAPGDLSAPRPAGRPPTPPGPTPPRSPR